MIPAPADVQQTGRPDAAPGAVVTGSPTSSISSLLYPARLLPAATTAGEELTFA
jgi:hypothetical protein